MTLLEERTQRDRRLGVALVGRALVPDGGGGVVRRSGETALENLADDSATGFVFERFEPDALAAAIRRAFALHARRSEWKATQQRGMRQDFGWGTSAERYLALYRELV